MPRFGLVPPCCRQLYIVVLHQVGTDLRRRRRVLRVPDQRLAQRFSRMRIVGMPLEQSAPFCPSLRRVGEDFAPSAIWYRESAGYFSTNIRSPAIACARPSSVADSVS